MRNILNELVGGPRKVKRGRRHSWVLDTNLVEVLNNLLKKRLNMCMTSNRCHTIWNSNGASWFKIWDPILGGHFLLFLLFIILRLPYKKKYVLHTVFFRLRSVTRTPETKSESSVRRTPFEVISASKSPKFELKILDFFPRLIGQRPENLNWTFSDRST